MLFKTKPLVITVQLWIVGKTELYGTTHNHIDRDVPVCLCHNTPIDAAGSMTGRCAMILNGFFHDLYLVCREPTAKPTVLGKDAATRDVMDSTRTRHPYVVIGGNGIYHVKVSTCLMGQVKGTPNDTGDMLQVMGTVKLCILRQDLGLHKLYQVKAWMSY